MISIYLKGRNEPLEWSVGKVVEIDVPEVEELQADGEELGLILREFHGLPFHNGRMNAWFGDLAKMIADRVDQLSDKNKSKIRRRQETKVVP